MEHILLNKKKSKKSINSKNTLSVNLSASYEHLPQDDIVEKVDAYNSYFEEKDNSEKYRLIFTINPICTNILFNTNTEIVYKEGSDVCVALTPQNDTIDLSGISESSDYYQNYKGKDGELSRLDAIRDTAFSHPEIGGFVYHCGIDIFNNHYLRKKGFKVVNKINGDAFREDFNTLRDRLRNKEGEEVSEKLFKIYSNRESDTTMHLYEIDEVKSFLEALKNGLIEDNGWVGFINPCTMSIANYGNISINKCMNNNKNSEQIDMYPDRSLYSFIPKYNKYRHRYEKNWDYCLTYPYSSDTENSIVTENKINGIKCQLLTDISNSIVYKEDGEEFFNVVFKSQIKNNLLKGDYVNFTFFLNGKSYTTLNNVRVEYVEDEKTFSVNFGGISDCLLNLKDETGTLEGVKIRVRKNILGADCKYYFRIFKKVPNFNRGIDDFNSCLNKLAFSENIFSDKIAQIIFNDDIVTSEIRDNLGRNISELHLTIIKRSKGNKKWYEENEFNTEEIEYSHCFTDITSGLDLGPENDEYNIHKINSIDGQYTSIEDEITIDRDTFYGDIVEFSPYEVNETVLENVYHRFNTYQRECNYGGEITYDEIVYDDYDFEDYKIESKTIKNISNINKEGYYYKPHYRIKLCNFKDIVEQGEDTHIVFQKELTKISSKTYSGETNVPYYLTIGEKIYLHNGSEKIKGKITKVEGPLFTIIEISTDEDIYDISKYKLFKPNILKPNGAYELNDGSGRYLWREMQPSKEIMYGDELFSSIFTNGAHYFHTSINFYLKRQDPYGEYGLNLINDEEKSSSDIITGAAIGKYKEISTAEYIKEEDGEIC